MGLNNNSTDDDDDVDTTTTMTKKKTRNNNILPLPTYKDQVREQQQQQLSSSNNYVVKNHRINTNTNTNNNVTIHHGRQDELLSSSVKEPSSLSSFESLNDSSNNDTLIKILTAVHENNINHNHCVQSNDNNYNEQMQHNNAINNPTSHKAATSVPFVQYRNNNNNNNDNIDDWNTCSSITTESGEYAIVEAIPVQSMILVTAQIVVDNDNSVLPIVDATTTTVQSSSHRSPNDRNTVVTNFDQIIITSTAPPDIDKFSKKLSYRLISYKSIIAAVLLVAVIIIIIGSTYMFDGNCIGKRHCSKTTNHRNNNTTTDRINNNNNNIPNPEFNIPGINRKKKQFTSRKELLKAVEDYMYEINLDILVTTYGTIEEWDVSGVQDFHNIFSTVYRGTTFTADISRWNLSSANDTSFMFLGAQKFNADLSKWDVSKVITFSNMFNSATSFTSNISLWNVSSAIYMDNMFTRATNFNSDLSQWDVSSVQTMNSMFLQAESFDSDLSNWDVSSVQDMTNMFAFATNFTSDLSKWDISQVTSLSGFVQKTNLFDSNLSKWNTSGVQLFDEVFSYAQSFRGIGIEQWDVSNGTTFDSMFRGTIYFDTNLSLWDVSNATSMIAMFAETKLFRGTGLQYWNVTKVTTTHGMFQRAQAFNCNLSQWDLSKDFDMISMFASTMSFQGIGLNTWQYHHINPSWVDTSAMFCNAIALNQSYISEWTFLTNDTYNCLED